MFWFTLTAQFVVEVGASDSGVGTVLSQRTTSDQKQHPCAYFYRQLSPGERNYDVGTRELLAVVLALQEWRHWLEGSTHAFVVWSNHKNLSYHLYICFSLMFSTYCVFMFYVVCYLYAPLYQEKIQVGVNLLGNKHFLILIHGGLWGVCAWMSDNGFLAPSSWTP